MRLASHRFRRSVPARTGRLASSCAVVLAAALLLLWTTATAQTGTRSPQATAVSIELSGTIDPASAGWITGALDDAQEEGRPLAIIRMDTPGGLDSSMRDIVRKIGEIDVPVVVHVFPAGARAASAGLFITLAADVAVMAPQTNIGSATPVTLGGGDTADVMGRKIENDAVAYARALSEVHGRDADLAERMVRDAINVTASTALESGLVDLVAGSEAELLENLDGYAITGPKERTLDTSGLTIERRDMPLEDRIRQFLVNPSIAYILLLAGLMGIAIEIFSPGLVGPGLFGAVAFLLGLYGTAQLPVTAAGVILLLLAVGLIIAETQVPSFGVLGIAGVAALVAGGLLLFDTDSDAFDVSLPVAAASGVVLGGFTLFAASKAIAARSAPPRSGVDDLVGAIATARTALDPTGQVYAQGALWRARLTDEAAEFDAPVEAGTRLRVEFVTGLTAHVRPASPSEKEESP